MRRGGRYRDDYGWGRYVPVAERRAKAAREMAKLAKKGHPVSPVVIEGTRIAKTFWGKAWCDNLERYSDYSNRLPRGRTYVRNGSVVDLQIGPGEVAAVVSGSELYTVSVAISPVPGPQWIALCKDCGGAVDSLVELLQGRLSKAVMERICRPRTGLFPAPAEIRLACSCPDSATMCKHVAAVLYGVGARLDERPELLFRLRQVDAADLIAHAGAGLASAPLAPASGRVLDDSDLSAIFGVEFGVELGGVPDVSPPARPAAPARPPAGILAKGAEVRMLAGIHAGRTGVVTCAKDDGGKAIYTVTFRTDDGRATTQVRSTSLGMSWEPVVAKAPAKVQAAARKPASPTTRAKNLAAPVLPPVPVKGTAVRMLAGMYAGCSGFIAGVHAPSGRMEDALYFLALEKPDGHRARTSVKRSSFGKTWTMVDKARGP